MENEKEWKDTFGYINKYQKEHYDRITVLRKAGEKKKLTEAVKEKGFRNVSEFINAAIDEKLKRLKIEL